MFPVVEGNKHKFDRDASPRCIYTFIIERRLHTVIYLKRMFKIINDSDSTIMILGSIGNKKKKKTKKKKKKKKKNRKLRYISKRKYNLVCCKTCTVIDIHTGLPLSISGSTVL